MSTHGYLPFKPITDLSPRDELFQRPILTYDQIRVLGHKQQMGIYKPKKLNYATSIITNVGEYNPNYEDHLDADLVLTYHGRGKDRHQTLDDYDNMALARNIMDQQPVRVFAGSENRYRDWGFWDVLDLSTEMGKDGFLKLVYKLIPVSAEPKVISDVATIPGVDPRITRYAKRKIKLADQQARYAPELDILKRAYGRCQISGEHTVVGRKGPKLHVHHVYPVGEGGELVTPFHSNEIVVCPNCHALFDDGSLYIDPSDGITVHHWSKDEGYEGVKLFLVQGHVLSRDNLVRAYELHYERPWM